MLPIFQSLKITGTVLKARRLLVSPKLAPVLVMKSGNSLGISMLRLLPVLIFAGAAPRGVSTSSSEKTKGQNRLGTSPHFSSPFHTFAEFFSENLPQDFFFKLRGFCSKRLKEKRVVVEHEASAQVVLKTIDDRQITHLICVRLKHLLSGFCRECFGAFDIRNNRKEAQNTSSRVI